MLLPANVLQCISLAFLYAELVDWVMLYVTQTADSVGTVTFELHGYVALVIMVIQLVCYFIAKETILLHEGKGYFEGPQVDS